MASSTSTRCAPRRAAWLVAALLLASCAKRSPDANDDPTAWQHHGLRPPTARCTFDVPAGFERTTPMPDHIAELRSPGQPIATITVAERVERDVASARTRAVAYYRAGLLTGAGAKITADGAFPQAAAPAHLLSLRYGPEGQGNVETLVLFAFGGKTIELLARHDERNTAAGDAVVAFARSLRCRTD